MNYITVINIEILQSTVLQNTLWRPCPLSTYTYNMAKLCLFEIILVYRTLVYVYTRFQLFC